MISNQTNYMLHAAEDSKYDANHWFRYLNKIINSEGIHLEDSSLNSLMKRDELTMFQKVTLQLGCEMGSSMNEYIINLSKPSSFNFIKQLIQSNDSINLDQTSSSDDRVLEIKTLCDDFNFAAAGDLIKNLELDNPQILFNQLRRLGHGLDSSIILECFGYAYGMDWLKDYLAKHQDRYVNQQLAADRRLNR